MEPSFFRIEKITADVTDVIRTRPVKPHRHDYEELLILTAGEADHFIDFRREHIAAPLIVYIATGRIHQIVPEPELRGWVIRYRAEFIPDSRFHFYSAFLDTLNYTLQRDFCLESVDSICELMLREADQPAPDYATLRHLLKAVLSKLETERDRMFNIAREGINPRQVALMSFLHILEDNYHRPEGVSFYADKMNTSVRNLNHICSSVLGKSVSELIETRKLMEARHLLLASGMTVAEIGYSLGYSEKSYFTRVFRKKTGLTPTDFRKAMQARVA